MNDQEFKESFENAVALWNEGNYSAALTILIRLEREYPDTADVIYAKARCLLSLTRFEEARSVGRQLTISLKDPRGKEIVGYAIAKQETLATRRARTRPYRLLLRMATRPLTLIIIAIIIVLLPLLLSLSKRGKSLTLQFPQQSIGTLYYQESNAQPPAWQPLGEASGAITLPSSSKLKLVISPRSDTKSPDILDLSSLTRPNMRLIREIHAPHAILSEQDIEQITAIRTLHFLDLSHTGVTDDGISNVILMTELQELYLQDNPITDTAAKWIAAITTLKKLDIRHTNITDTGIGYLTQLTSLTELRLPHHLTDQGLRRLAQISTLQSLDLNRTNITGNGLTHLTQLLNLTRIDISATRVGPEGFTHLAQFPDLQYVDASHTLINDTALESIGQIGALRTLNLDGALITDSGLQQLTDLQNLTRLSLNTYPNPPEMTQTAIDVLNIFPNLQNLTLSADTSQHLDIQTLNPNIALHVVESTASHPIINLPTDATLGYLEFRADRDPPNQWQPLGQAQGTYHLAQDTLLSLRTNPQTSTEWGRLRFLGTRHLARIQFDQETWDRGNALLILNEFPNLHEIVIEAAPVQLSHLKALASLPKLTTLRLHDINLTQDTLEFIRTLQNLYTLDLAGSTLPPNSNFTQQDMPNLHTLILPTVAPTNLYTIEFPSEPLTAYISMRPVNAGPDIPWTTARKIDAEVIAPKDQEIRLLLHNPSVQDFQILAQNDLQNIVELALLGPEVNNALVRELSIFPNLQHLQLSTTPITDEALANLHTLAQLSSIGLANTAITDEALTHLTAHPSLTHIDLANTPITNAGLLSLTENKNLQELNLEGADVNLETIKRAQRRLPTALLTFHRDQSTNDTTRLRPAIVLTIDQAKPLGALSIRHRNSDDPLDWQPLGRPTFDTPIPARQELKIRLEPRDLIDLTPLASTNPQDFHILEFPSGAQISPEIIEAISHWTSLHTIIFDNTVIHHDALQSLTEMPSLTTLSFHKATLSPDALSPLRTLTQLQQLDLSESTISPLDFPHIATLPNLHTLNLRDTHQLNDAALAYIQALPSVQELNLARTRITDQGLKLLGGFEQLKTLHLYQTLTTRQFINTLQIQRRRATIHHEGLAFTQNGLNRLTESLLATDTPTTPEYLTQLLNITTLEELLPQSLTDLQFTLLEAAIRATHAINATTFHTIATLVPPEQAPVDQLATLQQTALQYLAEYARSITASDLSALAGVENFRNLANNTRLQLQRWAVTALAEYPDLLTAQNIADIAGVQTLTGLTEQDQSQYRSLVIEVMADSATGITEQAFAGLLGTPTIEDAPSEQVRDLQQVALSAMANSDTGFTSQSIASVAGESRFGDIDKSQLRALQETALSAMAKSDTGVTANRLAQIAGAQRFQDVAENERLRLQRSAVHEIAKSTSEISSAQLARLAGKEDLEELSAEERSSIQAIALSAMARSDSGVTAQGKSNIGWNDSFRNMSKDERLAARSKAITELAKAQVPFTEELVNAVFEGEAVEVLDFSGTNITDQDLAMLNSYDDIRVLDLSGNKDITDKTLSLLSRSEALEILFLTDTNITDEGLKYLESATALHSLHLAQTAITGTGFAVLVDLPQLQTLNLDRIPTLTQQGIIQIASLPKLRTLSLNATPITDQSVQALTNITTLQDLDITDTQVTLQGIGQLITEMPGCNIQQDLITREEIDQAARTAQSSQRLWLVLGITLILATTTALTAYVARRQFKKNPEKFLRYRERFNLARRINAERSKHFRENLKNDGIYYTLYTLKGSKALVRLFWKALPYALGIAFVLVLFRILSYSFLGFLESISDSGNTPSDF